LPGFSPLAIYLLSTIKDSFLLPPSTELIFLLVFTSALSGFSDLSLFRAITLGDVSIVVPIAYSAPAVAVVLSIILFEESLTWLQGVGIILAIAGVILVSTDLSELRKKVVLAGVPEALFTMFGWGIYLTLLKAIVDSIGPTQTALFVELIAVLIILVLLLLYRKTDVGIPHDTNIRLMVTGVAFLSILGVLAYNTGIGMEKVSLVNPISSMGPAVTLALAWVFLKERLVLNQKVGFVCILAALWLIAAGGGG
jgi:transporter family protein